MQRADEQHTPCGDSDAPEAPLPVPAVPANVPAISATTPADIPAVATTATVIQPAVVATSQMAFGELTKCSSIIIPLIASLFWLDTSMRLRRKGLAGEDGNA